MRRLSRPFAVVSLALGAVVAISSLMIEGPTISTGLVIGFILVLYGAMRLYETGER